MTNYNRKALPAPFTSWLDYVFRDGSPLQPWIVNGCAAEMEALRAVTAAAKRVRRAMDVMCQDDPAGRPMALAPSMREMVEALARLEVLEDGHRTARPPEEGDRG